MDFLRVLTDLQPEAQGAKNNLHKFPTIFRQITSVALRKHHRGSDEYLLAASQLMFKELLNN